MLQCSVKGVFYLLELPWDPVLGSDGGVATCSLGAASTDPGQVRPGLVSLVCSGYANGTVGLVGSVSVLTEKFGVLGNACTRSTDPHCPCP